MTTSSSAASAHPHRQLLPELVLDFYHPHKATRGSDVVRTTLGSQRYYLLSNPDHVRHVLQDNKNYVKEYGNAHLRVSTA
jgi:cytochrome P450